MHRTSACIALLLCAALSQVVNARKQDEYIQPLEGSAGSGHFVEGEPWREGEAKYPDPPKDENLVRLAIDRLGGGFEVFLDRPSLTIGEDGIVRYTVVLRTRQGANNVYYEGIRCDTQAYKTYAYGTLKGGFKELRTARWRDISPTGGGDYHYELYSDYFCEASIPRDMKRIDRMLKGYDEKPGQSERY